MPEQKKGLIVFGNRDTKTAYILEEKPERKVHPFNLETVNGNIDEHDNQARTFPVRIVGAVVVFSTDADGNVDTVNLTGHTDRMAINSKTQCGNCQSGLGGAIQSSGKDCACGNMTYSSWEQCEVCALSKNECVSCGGEMVSF